MSAVPTRAAPPSAAYRCHRRCAPASRHPRTRVTRAAAGPERASTKAPSSPSSSSPPHVVVVPGFLSGAARYRGMARALELENTFASVTVVPVTRDMWFPTLAGADFTPMLDAIDTCVRSIGTSTERDVCVVGHSAGGWLARLWMGDAPYGKNGKTYGGAARVQTLLTLGTPHYSLEKYPFGRIPENLAANVVDSDGSDPADGSDSNHDDRVWTAERAAGSSLALTNYRYPGTWHTNCRYVSVCGDAIAGAQPTDLAQYLLLTLGDVGSSLKDVFGCIGAGVSYGASVEGGVVGVRGDGVTPLDTARLAGSEYIKLMGVTHQPDADVDDDVDGAHWYGTPSVVKLWARRLLTPTPGGEETVFEWGKETAFECDEVPVKMSDGGFSKNDEKGTTDAGSLWKALEAALTGASNDLTEAAASIESFQTFPDVNERRMVSDGGGVEVAGAPLWQACLAVRNGVPGSVAVSKALLRTAQCDPNAGGSHGGMDDFFATSPLWWAASAVEAGGGTEAVNLSKDLIDAGADVNATGRYEFVEGPPLWWSAIAVRNGEVLGLDLARVLIGGGADVKGVTGSYGPGVNRISPLLLSAQGVPGNGGCAELTRVLFVNGARLDVGDAAALVMYRLGSAMSIVKSEVGA